MWPHWDRYKFNAECTLWCGYLLSMVSWATLGYNFCVKCIDGNSGESYIFLVLFIVDQMFCIALFLAYFHSHKTEVIYVYIYIVSAYFYEHS